MPEATAGLDYIMNAVGAAAALGLAAYGIVDATKLFWGGISNVGFGHIDAALRPYASALSAAVGDDWAQMVRAHWINGVAKDEQKAKAKALIRLGLSAVNADKIAAAVRVDPAAFQTAVAKIQSGPDVELDKSDVELFGRFDAAIEAAVDAALERADQQYRNAAKLLAGVVGVGLAIVAAGAMSSLPLEQFLFSGNFWLATIIGAVSVPLAPIAKDLATSLQSAAKAVKAFGA